MEPTQRLGYWNSFYRQKGLLAPSIPSQFAAFVLGELDALGAEQGFDGVIEFGCGNGRDSQFFAGYGLNVLAMDASEQAVELCRTQNHHPQFATFLQCNATESRKDIEQFIVGKQRVAVYARFFLHAIQEAEQSTLLDILRDVLPASSLLFFEYRTVADALQGKVFGEDHYRRYLDHAKALEMLEAAGFKTLYEIEGNGLAKYRDEDAKVGRCIAIKRDT